MEVRQLYHPGMKLWLKVNDDRIISSKKTRYKDIPIVELPRGCFLYEPYIGDEPEAGGCLRVISLFQKLILEDAINFSGVPDHACTGPGFNGTHTFACFRLSLLKVAIKGDRRMMVRIADGGNDDGPPMTITLDQAATLYEVLGQALKIAEDLAPAVVIPPREDA